MFNKVKAREASISIEISLSVLLASAVLILALGLFSESLKAMALNSNMSNFFKGNKLKTANTYVDKTPTATKVTVAQVPQGQNVQIVADQGLSGAHNEAKRIIEQYASLTTPLTQAQLNNLALQLTIFGVSGTQAPYAELGSAQVTSNGQSMSYMEFAYKNGIDPDFIYGTTTVGANTYDWTNDYSGNGTRPDSSEQDRLANIDVIKTKIK